MPHNEWLKLCASDPAQANAICAEKMGWRYGKEDGAYCSGRGIVIEVIVPDKEQP